MSRNIVQTIADPKRRMDNSIEISKPVLWTGRVLKALIVIFLLVDASMKIIKHPIYVKASTDFGLPESSVAVLGAYVLIATILYILPGTAIYGILFIVAYLGGAVAITFLSAKEGHPYIFPLVFAAFTCAAEFLINPTIKNILSLKKQ
jgi:hypothetical protein